MKGEIALLAPSQNELLRMHWAKRKSRKAAVGWFIIEQFGRLPPSKALKRAKVYITRVAMGKEPDPDNLVASAKLILDALQDCNIIADDSPEHIDLDVRWQRAAKKADQKTIIEVLPV